MKQRLILLILSCEEMLKKCLNKEHFIAEANNLTSRLNIYLSGPGTVLSKTLHIIARNAC